MSVLQFAPQWKEVLRAGKDSTPASNLVVFSTSLLDGTAVPLARFGEDIWLLPANIFPRNYTNEGQRRLNFGRVAESFRVPLKLCTLRYAHFGLEGSAPAKGNTLVKFVNDVGLFLRFVHGLGVSRLSDVTPMHCAQYVEHCRRRKSVVHGSPRRLSSQTLHILFSKVETLHRLSRHCAEPMTHPWPDTSAFFLSGNISPNHRELKTQIIPDEALSSLFQFSEGMLHKADYLLKMRDELDFLRGQWSDKETVRNKFKKLYSDGPEGLAKQLQLLLGSCMAIVFIGSGIRSHELGYLETDCAFTTVDSDDDRFHWIRGRSDKTGEGTCSWLVPSITHRAIEVAEQVTRPLRERLFRGFARLRDLNSEGHRAADRDSHKNSLFITRWSKEKDYVSTMNHDAQNRLLKLVAQAAGIEWAFATHQFRRTFAVYAARSALGDLRYLRKHFKHWSIDMTAAYAAAQDRDEELFDDVGLEIRNQKVEVVQHWLEKDTLLSGGMADSIRSFRARNEAVETYKTRRDLAMKLSDLVSIRATGVAWCTADKGGCNGGQGVEKTRCSGCINAVIDNRKLPAWQGIYQQQLELTQIKDIGPAGLDRVQRDTERCRAVLIDLGARQEDLDRAAA